MVSEKFSERTTDTKSRTEYDLFPNGNSAIRIPTGIGAATSIDIVPRAYRRWRPSATKHVRSGGE